MLVLDRKVGDRIHIGDDIVIEVQRIRRYYDVRLAVYAPRDIPVLRGELARREPTESPENPRKSETG